MPQGGDKRDWERVEFGVMLPNINLLYLFLSVLILADLSYVSRFWVRPSSGSHTHVLPRAVETCTRAGRF